MLYDVSGGRPLPDRAYQNAAPRSGAALRISKLEDAEVGMEAEAQVVPEAEVQAIVALVLGVVLSRMSRRRYGRRGRREVADCRRVDSQRSGRLGKRSCEAERVAYLYRGQARGGHVRAI